MANNNTITLTCWLLDTRSFWRGERTDNILKAARDVLQLLPPDEREKCTNMVQLPGGKEQLGSGLLKRYFVSKTLGIPWNDVRYGRKGDPKRGKPAAVLFDDTFANVDFNVSHQAELVALVGTGLNDRLAVGVDIVCTNERDTYTAESVDRRKGGFDKWVHIYDSTLSNAELRDLKNPRHLSKAAPDDGFPSKFSAYERAFDDDELYKACSDPVQRPSEKFSTEQKLRRFFAMWAYKEAYTKMEGQGLLADWIKELEFFGLRAPLTAKEQRQMAERNAGVSSSSGVVAVNFDSRANEDPFGERIDGAVAFLKKKPVTHVSLSIQAYDENYMIALAVRAEDTETKSTHKGQSRKDSPPDIAWSFEIVSLDEILEYARSNRQ